jgi:mRNA-degrading endonuclease RelE of RelBE toxin-antitoxin system
LRNIVLARIEQVLQTPSFKKAAKKLHKNQKLALDKAVKEVVNNPKIGELKKGDLSFMRVYKFKMVKQLTFLGYSYEDGAIILELIALGTHENFYRTIGNG